MRCRHVLAVVAVLATALTIRPAVHAAFTGKTQNSGNTWAAAAAHPSYDTMVANSAWSYHRLAEAQNTAANSTAADVDTLRPGTYASATYGPVTWLKMDGGTRAAALGRGGR